MCVGRPARVRDVHLHLHLLLCSFRLWRVSCVCLGWVVSWVVVSGGFLDVVARCPCPLSYPIPPCACVCVCACVCACAFAPSRSSTFMGPEVLKHVFLRFTREEGKWRGKKWRITKKCRKQHTKSKMNFINLKKELIYLKMELFSNITPTFILQ